MTSNRPLEEWGKLLNDVPTAGAILDRFLHHAQVIAPQQIRSARGELRRREAGIRCHPFYHAAARPRSPDRVADMPTALITGAGGGLGSAIAAALAPTHTLLLAGRPSKRLDDVARRLGAGTVALDLADTQDIQALVAHSDIVDALDVLVHNAGVAFPDLFVESRIHDWRTTFEVNVIGPVALTHALLPALRRAKGQVIFVNSGAGLNVLAGMASYSASKFALRAFADSLRQSEPSLRITTVYPGRTDTDMQRELVASEGGDYDPDRFLRPDTVAEAVAHAVATPPDGHLHEVVLRPRG